MGFLSSHLSLSIGPQSTTPLNLAPPSTAIPSPIQTPETVMSLCRTQCLHPLYPVALTAQLQKSTGNVNYIALDFHSVSQSPHRNPSTSSVPLDEKGEYVQIDKEKTQALQKTIQEWTKMQQSSRPSKDAKLCYSSLFNDFVESEFFLIDGDSLFVTCLFEKSLKPGQSLHFFYLVERYLLDIISKGGQFAIVFFKKKWCEYFILSNLHTFELWSLNSLHLSDLSDEPLLKNIAFYYENENAQEISQEKMPNLGFIPMSCSLVDEFTGDILKDLPFLKSDDPIVTSLVKHKEFDELVHWHSHRPLSDDYDRTKASFDEHSRDPRQLRSLQKYQVFQRFYGNSLESVSSKIITTQSVKPKKDCSKSRSTKAHETKADIIARENKKRLIAKEEQKEEQKWNVLSSSIEKEMKRNLNSGMQKLEEFLKSCKSNSVKVQAEKVGLTACLTAWREHCRAEVQLSPLTPLSHLRFISQLLISKQIASFEGMSHLSRFPFRFSRELLDVVDNYESAVIVAPTSSGKTYASYYCMEKVLKESNEGVVVYVAPTKALVNQVAATVQSRYTKILPTGGALCGVFTRDYRHDALNCQIEKYGFPSDLAFSPRESIQLYDTMLQVWKSWPQAQNLCPENFTHLKNKIVIKKSDAREYEKSLKEEFTNWVKNGNEEQARMVLQKLSPNFCDYSGQMLKFFPNLVEKLREMEKLPALFFLFRFASVEQCAEDACQFLEDKQDEKRPPNADKEAHVMAKKLRKVKKSLEKPQQIIDEKSKKPSRRLDQIIMHEAEYNYLLKSLEKHLEIPEDCTYADQKAIDDEMSGRAGRRGQDLLGDVYFFNIPLPKISKLIKSKVPELRGQFPLSISLILRLLLLASKADDLEDGKAKVFLDDLPEDFNEALNEYNMKVTMDFAAFLLIVSRLADMKQEYQLPLSKIVAIGSTLLHYLIDMCEKIRTKLPCC
ncbi:putative ATP-dependent RNA helicase DDX60 [Cricetulus griseus]|uniref:Putative ATP-dependent RNA helicase DDX60 n=1 Tax=Cricetulus griseus TaxID=10029 RepID=G3H3B4_CRIGR|nr:putative ATP-dependent RNA helicase DDX60 [Cricetulus griseus]